jgi:radical SAM superfamily enzyme YgiQ (UPF0313 family)
LRPPWNTSEGEKSHPETQFLPLTHVSSFEQVENLFAISCPFSSVPSLFRQSVMRWLKDQGEFLSGMTQDSVFLARELIRFAHVPHSIMTALSTGSA